MGEYGDSFGRDNGPIAHEIESPWLPDMGGQEELSRFQRRFAGKIIDSQKLQV
jgi:hypothetical protein